MLDNYALTVTLHMALHDHHRADVRSHVVHENVM